MEQTNPYTESLQVAKDSLSAAEENLNQATSAHTAATQEVATQQAAYDHWVADNPTPAEGEAQSDADTPADEGSDNPSTSEGDAEAPVDGVEQSEEAAQEETVSVTEEVRGRNSGVVDAVEDLVNQVSDEDLQAVQGEAGSAGVTVNDKFDAVKFLIGTKQS